jgi:hypothetical protein
MPLTTAWRQKRSFLAVTREPECLGFSPGFKRRVQGE